MMKWASDQQTGHLFKACLFVVAISAIATLGYVLNGWGAATHFI